MAAVVGKLGKLEPVEDRRSLRLDAYVDRTVLVAPRVGGARHVVKVFPMLANDEFGDCVFAGAQHETQQFRARVKRPVFKPTVKGTLAAYSAVTGFDKNDASTDRGAVVLDALNFRRKTGIEGHKIGAFAQVEAGNRQNVRLAVHLFGVLGIGLALPAAAQEQTGTWHLGPRATGSQWEPGSWGGHYVPIIAYDASGLTCVTWGALKTITWQFFDRYCEEAWAILSPDWLSHGRSHHGLDLAALQADLAAIGTPG